MKSISIILFLVFSLVYESMAQIGGDYVFNFIDLPATARITGMGGNLIAFKDDDPGQAADNPSLLNPEMDRTLVMSYNKHFADINNGFVSYTFDHKIGTFNTAIKYIDYGSFRETDAGNNELGSFSANELMFLAGMGKQLDSSFSVGANVKFIYSNLYLYSSSGMAIDLSATYQISKVNFSAVLLVKNMGFQFSPYIAGQQEPLPFDVQMGISKKFANMPFRFSLVIHQIAKGKLTYPAANQATSSTFGDEPSSTYSGNTLDNVMRHVIIGTEFIPSKNFNIRIAYNFQQRREMVYEEKEGAVGLSWGFGLRISKLHISYARSAYHLAGSPNHFTILTRFDDWKKKSK